jgi:hypothetical protein
LDKPGGTWTENENEGIPIHVKEEKNDHELLRQRGGPVGRFTFTVAESGIHIICISTNMTSWSASRTKLFLDLVFGDTNVDRHVGKQDLLNGTPNEQWLTHRTQTTSV